MRKGGLYIFQIRKPLGYLKELSKAQNVAKSKTVAENLPDTQYSEGDPVLVHIFWAQRGLDNNSRFTTSTYHVNASIISVYDPSQRDFVLLPMDSIDQLAYSTIISRQIRKSMKLISI